MGETRSGNFIVVEKNDEILGDRIVIQRVGGHGIMVVPAEELDDLLTALQTFKKWSK